MTHQPVSLADLNALLSEPSQLQYQPCLCESLQDIAPRQKLVRLNAERLRSVQDGTLIAQKSNQRFATSASDWKLYNERVPKVLQDFVDDGFRVVIFR